MAEPFSDSYLEKLSIYLREESNRRNISHSEIEHVFNHLMKNVHFQNSIQLHTSILSLKILSNYIADVPENCSFLMSLVKDDIYILPSNSIQLSNPSLDIKEITLFHKVTVILFNNLLTTNKESIPRKQCMDIFDNLIESFTLCESAGIETDNESLIEVIDECQSIIGKIDSERFLLLRDLCRYINDSAKSCGDEDLILLSSKVILKYSCNLEVVNNDSVKEELFFKLFSDINSVDDEQILLNISYELKIGSNQFFKKLLNLVFDSNGLLKITKGIPMLMIILSNEITTEFKMNEFLNIINIYDFNELYFNNIYPNLSLKLPWELQSIVLLNKIPISRILIGYDALNKYINKLSKLISYTTIQIRSDIISLQLVFLSKILANTKNKQQLEHILNYLTDIKLSNDYSKFSNEFKLVINQVYFPYLGISKRKNLQDEKFSNVLQIVLTDSSEIIQKSLIDKTPIQMKYLIELSQIFGFYVKNFKTQEWFVDSFQSFENIVEDSKRQIDLNNQKLTGYEQTAWNVLQDNFKYTDVLLKQSEKEYI
ncbi:hypothetical protein C6P40_003152 [Pichia californica]|uniref:Uncharacterized protein n=1 Tax=Pichia californica TaxID=460514 RepID=A0A9P7BHP9_9ASCO|nr:hypothetical protein C6P42_004252 [[Candida] californica]KAG0690334.1 hypothetical protein C6P40_003152 [[Candida] californica]